MSVTHLFIVAQALEAFRLALAEYTQDPCHAFVRRNADFVELDLVEGAHVRPNRQGGRHHRQNPKKCKHDDLDDSTALGNEGVFQGTLVKFHTVRKEWSRWFMSEVQQNRCELAWQVAVKYAVVIDVSVDPA